MRFSMERSKRFRRAEKRSIECFTIIKAQYVIKREYILDISKDKATYACTAYLKSDVCLYRHIISSLYAKWHSILIIMDTIRNVSHCLTWRQSRVASWLDFTVVTSLLAAYLRLDQCYSRDIHIDGWCWVRSKKDVYLSTVCLSSRL